MFQPLPKSPVPTARENASSLVLPLAPGLADSLLLIARILVGYVFVIGGWGKMVGLWGFAGYLEGKGLPFSTGLAVVAAVFEFLFGLFLILGLWTRYAVLALIVFVIIATGIAHRFWEFEEAARRTEAIAFNKNMAIIGGLLALFAAGPGRVSIDYLVARKRN